MSEPKNQKTKPDFICILESKNDEQDETIETSNEVTIRGNSYLIKRHFVSKRSFRDAVYMVVKNEAFKD